MIEIKVTQKVANSGATLYELFPSDFEIGMKGNSGIDRIHVTRPDDWVGMTLHLLFADIKGKQGISVPVGLDDTYLITEDVTRGPANGLVFVKANHNGKIAISEGASYTVCGSINTSQKFPSVSGSSSGTGSGGTGSAGLSEDDLLQIQELISSAAQSESAAALSAEQAEESSLQAQQAAIKAQQAADSAKSYADAADALHKLGDLEELSARAEQAKLYAKASESYAKEAESANAAVSQLRDELMSEFNGVQESLANSVETATTASQAAEAAASRSEAAIQAAAEAVENAKSAAVEEILSQSEPILQASNTASVSAQNASTSADEAAVSAANAARYAESAEQVAAKNGYFYFGIEGGRLIETRTDNVEEDMNFSVEEGRLILNYE